MPDIAMCSGEGCPQRNRCYRATATPSTHRQTYFATPPVKADGTCDHFWQRTLPNESSTP